MQNFLIFLKHSNGQQIADLVGVSRQYINLLEKKKLTKQLICFYNICQFFHIKIEDIDIENYNQYLLDHKKIWGLSYMKLSFKISEDTERIKRICRIKSKSIVLFIKLYKIYKNGKI